MERHKNTSSVLKEGDKCLNNNKGKMTSPSRKNSDDKGRPLEEAGNLSSTEYFANTNVLTCRLKWVNPDTFIMDPRKPQLLTNLNQLVHANKGVLVNPKEMENYQYFSDHKRLAHLQENWDTYLFERGNAEVDSWYRDEELRETKANWFYDVVIQAQFKSYKDLQATTEGFKAELKEHGSGKKTEGTESEGSGSGSASPSSSSQILACWSISENPHALNHPGNLYVRGIPKNLTKEDLVPIFAKFGPIIVLKIILDPNTNESMGFGFVSYPLGSQASNCIKELNGNLMNGSPLFVNYHVERKERERIHFDQWKQNEQEENSRFRGVFIGNLPIFTNENKLITPSAVVQKFRESLPDCEIVSYYFPKSNSQSNVEYSESVRSQSLSPLNSKAAVCSSPPSPRPKSNDYLGQEQSIDEEIESMSGEDSMSSPTSEGEDNIDMSTSPSPTKVRDSLSDALNEETCSSQNEDSPLKGYGFIRFATHEMALKCIETFNEFQWYGHQLVVNKAVQKFHQHHYSYSNGSNNNLANANGGNYQQHHNNNHYQNQHHHRSSSTSHTGHVGHISPHQSYYQQSHMPSMYSYRLSRRHSERSISSRQSNVLGFSPPPIAAVPLNDTQHSRVNSAHSRSMSRQNSFNNAPYGKDPHSPLSGSQLSLPLPPLSQPIYTGVMPPNSPGFAGHPPPPPLQPLATQAIPVLTSSSTNSSTSPRNNSIYGALNMPISYSATNPMFGTPLPIPRSDEQESNLYVKHLPLDWKDEDLVQYFEKFGEIISAKIITVGGSVKEQDDQNLKNDELFGKSKGYGFVCFQNPLDASRAMYHTDGLKLNSESTLFVSFAQRRSKSIDSSKNSMGNTANYNKKFLNAMYQQQQQQQQQYHPWMIPVPLHYPPSH